MFRSFRPTFETLEKREVFAAGPLAAFQPMSAGGGANQAATDQMSVNFEAYKTTPPARVGGLPLANATVDVVFDRDMAAAADEIFRQLGMQPDAANGSKAAPQSVSSISSTYFPASREPLRVAPQTVSSLTNVQVTSYSGEVAPQSVSSLSFVSDLHQPLSLQVAPKSGSTCSVGGYDTHTSQLRGAPQSGSSLVGMDPLIKQVTLRVAPQSGSS